MENRSAPRRLNNPTWALGFLAVFFFAAELLSGLGLTFFYRPSVDSAWADVTDLREANPLGFLRDLHFWGSHILLVVVWLHLIRTFASGLYKPPRQGNWAVGVVLLALTLSLAYTGSLLPWDEEAYRSIATREPAVTGAEATPREIDQDTLWRFYVLHCGILPLVTIGLVAQHWRLARRRLAAAGDPEDG